MVTLKIGDKGGDVTRLQQLLNRHGYRLTVDGSFGALTGSAVVEAKHALGYPAKDCLPFAGDRFFRLLTSSHGSLLFVARKLKRKAKPAPGAVARGRIVAWAYWGVQHEPEIHYAETRPMPRWLEPLPTTTDCSGFATLCYRHAGVPDPNGAGYSGYGFTGTLLSHGKHVTKTQARPGDLVVYGPGTGWHVAVIVEAGVDPLTVSHGEEKGPELCRVSQDGREPQMFLSYLP